MRSFRILTARFIVRRFRAFICASVIVVEFTLVPAALGFRVGAISFEFRHLIFLIIVVGIRLDGQEVPSTCIRTLLAYI